MLRNMTNPARRRPATGRAGASSARRIRRLAEEAASGFGGWTGAATVTGGTLLSGEPRRPRRRAGGPVRVLGRSSLSLPPLAKRFDD
ncbi:hypothetical protein TESS_TESS_00563 [Tessaracoccus sp. O5.2]